MDPIVLQEKERSHDRNLLEEGGILKFKGEEPIPSDLFIYSKYTKKKKKVCACIPGKLYKNAHMEFPSWRSG